MPETYDELVTVLQAFKDKDANGNGEVTYRSMAQVTLTRPSLVLPFNNRLGGDTHDNVRQRCSKLVYLRRSHSYKQGIWRCMKPTWKAWSTLNSLQKIPPCSQAKLDGQGWRVSVCRAVGQQMQPFGRMPGKNSSSLPSIERPWWQTICHFLTQIIWTSGLMRNSDHLVM